MLTLTNFLTFEVPLGKSVEIALHWTLFYGRSCNRCAVAVTKTSFDAVVCYTTVPLLWGASLGPSMNTVDMKAEPEALQLCETKQR